MRHTDFRLLKKAQQIELLYRTAVYIGKRKEGATIIVLYQLNGFYVEIHYLKYRQYIRSIVVFESVDLLDPYLRTIDVEELINC